MLEDALFDDFDSEEVINALKSLEWWVAKIGAVEREGAALTSAQAIEKGTRLLAQWKPYYQFLERIGNVTDACEGAIKHFVSKTALNFFGAAVSEKSNLANPDILFMLGSCYKGIGNYKGALPYLREAAKLKREDANILAEFADCLAMLEETNEAKLFFREAYFWDPQAVDIRSKESDLFKGTVKMVRQKGYSGKELAEWIPVYAVLEEVFAFTRSLKEIALSRLKCVIVNLESEMNVNAANKSVLLPRLLNKYFWLIAHYRETKEDTKLLNEVYSKIKIHAPGIYEQYKGYFINMEKN
jgi:tetratricopeptide (TPR) repeat protein